DTTNAASCAVISFYLIEGQRVSCFLPHFTSGGHGFSFRGRIWTRGVRNYGDSEMSYRLFAILCLALSVAFAGFSAVQGQDKVQKKDEKKDEKTEDKKD